MKDFSSLFFNSNFAQNLDWKNAQLRMGTVTPQNKQQISASLRDMSHESIRNRFLGSKRYFSEKELEYLTTIDGWNHYAIGIEESEKLKRGVAIIRMVRSVELPTEAEVAITIIDEYQKMGLGSFLIDLIILAALEREITTLSFTFLPQNLALPRLLNKIALPIPGSSGPDSVQLYLNISQLNISDIKVRLQLHLESIETFHLKT